MNPFRRQRIKRPFWLRPLLLGLGALIAAGLGVWQAPKYQKWKGSRALAAGRAALARGDLDDAQLSLDIALRARGDAEVYDVLADFLERIASDRAIDARRRAAAAAP